MSNWLDMMEAMDWDKGDWDELVRRARQLARTQFALDYAILVIESYQLDIRSGWQGVELLETGFCQGSIYKNALKRIDQLLRGES